MPGATIQNDQNIFDICENIGGRYSLWSSVAMPIILSIGESNFKDLLHGARINYSSMSVDRVITRVVGYSASKAGIENFTRWMAVEMALKFGSGVRVRGLFEIFYRKSKQSITSK